MKVQHDIFERAVSNPVNQCSIAVRYFFCFHLYT